MADWTAALSRFPQFALVEAFDEWLAEETHRPSPAHIVKIAVRKVSSVRAEVQKLQAEPETPRETPSDEAKARMAQAVKNLLKPSPQAK